MNTTCITVGAALGVAPLFVQGLTSIWKTKHCQRQANGRRAVTISSSYPLTVTSPESELNLLLGLTLSGITPA